MKIHDVLEETQNETIEETIDETTLGWDPIEELQGQDPFGEVPETETSSDAPAASQVQVTFPDDYVTNEDFYFGIEQILVQLSGSADQEPLLADVPVALDIAEIDLPYDTVYFLVDGSVIIFPSDYAGDVHVVDGQLVNNGSSYTAGVVLPSSSVSNYIVSEITVPTYHSSTWYQYLNTYGQPYRVVDRYRSSSGSYSSYTRSSVDLTFSGGNDWAGFSLTKIFFIVLIVLILLREVRSWLTF